MWKDGIASSDRRGAHTPVLDVLPLMQNRDLTAEYRVCEKEEQPALAPIASAHIQPFRSAFGVPVREPCPLWAPDSLAFFVCPSLSWLDL